MRPTRVSSRGRSIGAALLAFGLFTASPASAAKPITGKLSTPGLTVLALDPGGQATTALAGRNGRFTLEPSARRVTLHLRGADGVYAGPVVIEKVGRKGKEAILGVKAGADLGKVTVRDGYAKLARELPAEDMNRAAKAKAKRGVPVGAGNFGRVAAQATGIPGPGQDLDRDGIPGALDIDDDGNLVLDNLEAAPTGGTPAPTRAGPAPPDSPVFNFRSELTVGLDDSLNANAPGVTPEQIGVTLAAFGLLQIGILPSDSTPELDCGLDDPASPEPEGLAYCRPGGTGAFWRGGVGPSTFAPFPGPPQGEFDPDGDGFGSLLPSLLSTTAVNLRHGSSTDRIATGDLPIQLITRGGEEVEVPGAVPFVLSTVPALVSYSDETTPEPVPVTYPVAPGSPGTPGDGGGPAPENPIPISDGPDADTDVELTLSFWRPQRTPIGAECAPPAPPCQWIDVGGLLYSTVIGQIGHTASGQWCPQSAYPSWDQGQLVPNPPDAPAPEPGFVDLAADRPADGSTFSYTVNLSQCAAALGVESEFNQGDEVQLNFRARAPAGGSPDTATQIVAVEKQ